MASIELTAPAKVNLFLKVLNKRKDGYHNIVTIFEKISLSDRITISKIPEGIQLSSDKFITDDPKDNLLYKAAELIMDHYGIGGGVAIKIKKVIPIGAGLGGGSSDAAAVLLGIDKLFNLKADRKDLMRLGARLGADVPFFLFNEPFAAGRGIGERLEKVNITKKLWHLIAYPGFKVLTKDIYKSFDDIKLKDKDKKDRGDFGLTRKSANAKIHPPLFENTKFGDLEAMLYNDLQDIVTAKESIIGSIIERLAYFLDRKVIVSGSGPSVFCLCRTRKEAMGLKKKVFSSLPSTEVKNWQVFIAKTED